MMEQAATSGKPAAQALFSTMGCERQVNIQMSTLLPQARYKYLDPLVTALSTVIKLL